MKQQKRFDKILDAIKLRTQDEVGGLLGTTFVLSDGVYGHVSKEDAFDELQGKHIAAEMDIVGDVTGKGSLLIGIKDAIRLGGTLIMLPDSELDEFIGREEYSEEIEDSYGEIANIVAGSFTKEFEEMYSKACRFVRKEQSTLVPAKVDIESDEPVENRQLYRATWSMSLDGTTMGKLVMLVPAATFGLEQDIEDTKTQEAGEAAADPAAAEAAPGGDGEQAQEGDAAPQTPKIDYEKQKKRIDKLLDECHRRMQDEVGGLLGVTAVMSELDNYFTSKEEFFEDRVSGRQVIADMEVVGDREDKSYFSVSIKDAIYLGGVLIMLPPSELETATQEEDFGDDAADAYGEIANIVSGVYTAVFEELYTKKLRFIKKGLTQVQPAKVETDSPDPIPDTLYYVNSLAVSVDGTQLGRVQMLFPAAMLDLYPPELQPEADAVETPQPEAVTSGAVEEKEGEQPPGAASPAETGVAPAAPRVDTAKHQALVDKLLSRCQETMQEEVTSLLGSDVEFKNINNKIVDKEGFFYDEVTGKQVLSHLDVGGDIEGKSYLSVDLRDAIRFGGILIMLPGSELETVVTEEDYGEDTADAYGEIANIIAGVYTAVFEEQYSKSLRFVRKEVQQVAPMKVDVDSDEPIPNQNYYVSQMDVVIGGNAYGKINLLFPLHLLELQGLLESDEEQAGEVGQERGASVTSGGTTETTATGGGQAGADTKPIDLLIIGDDETAAALIGSTVEGLGYSVKTLSYKDNLHNFLPGEVKAVYLVMASVNEQGFGTAIKISAACKIPLVAAGPGWTKSKVIKAVKYGVSDILLTPASADMIKQNVENNMLKKAA